MFLANEYTDGDFDLAELAGSEGNPFFTKSYLSYRRAVGDTPWLVGFKRENDQCLWGMVFITNGRFSCWLEMPSMPSCLEDSPYWDSLLEFCQQQGVTNLSINSYASMGGAIPVINSAEKRVSRCEYLLNLDNPKLFTSMRKGHKHNLSKARKAGLELIRRIDPDAVDIHAQLMADSMLRRKNRGEEVTIDVDADSLSAMVKAGSGELFQAVVDNRIVSSNLILLSRKGSYNQSQGTSVEGTECGAAHFLIHEAGLALRAEGKLVFNLGGTQQNNAGLDRFKTGFGVTIEQRLLESLSVQLKRRGVGRLLRSILAK